MRPLEALSVAIVRADAAGDNATVDRLMKMRSNPAALGQLLFSLESNTPEAGGVRAFADAGTATVLIPLAGEMADYVLAMGRAVRMVDLAPKGCEQEPHVTVFHGLYDCDPDAVGTIAQGFGPVPMTLGGVSVFPARPGKEYDVLKIDVASPTLVRLNAALANLPHEDDTFPFSPHCTIAFLKPGRGAYYAERFGRVDKMFVGYSLVYSDAMKNQIAYPLARAADFAEWRAGTSKGGESGWISSGGEFRKEKPHGKGDTVEDGKTAPDADHKKNVADLADTVAGSLANEPELKGKPGLLAKVKDLALTAGAHALLGMQRFQDHWSGKVVAELVDAYFDSPMDMKKLGYNPSNSAGTAHARVRDDVSSNLNDAIGMGLSGHLVAKIAAEVLSRGFIFLRNKLKGKPAQMADESRDKAQVIAEMLAPIFDAVNESLGLDGRADVTVIADAIRKLLAGNVEQMADKPADTAAELKPVTAHVGDKGKPASPEVALAGADGKELARVIRNAKALGVKRVADVFAGAAKRYTGTGEFLTEEETGAIAHAIASVNATAELLGRSRVRDIQEKAGGADPKPDEPFAKFADDPDFSGAIATPEAALDYFTKIYPSIGVDPYRWPGEQRRRAFTLAEAVSINVTRDVHERIAAALRDHANTPDAARAVQQALTDSGVTPANPQYSEMVFRTNAMDAYQTGLYDEGQSDDLGEMFPAWQYLGIKDGRQGQDHEPHFNKYYPRSSAFADVRGDRPFNCRCSLRWVDKFEWADLKDKGAKIEE